MYKYACFFKTYIVYWLGLLLFVDEETGFEKSSVYDTGLNIVSACTIWDSPTLILCNMTQNPY